VPVRVWPRAPLKMKKYFRVILGRRHKHFSGCFEGNFIGVGFIPEIDFKNE
tara:strand:+ start:465 stop:617 length:153 start_codon:yes stop_codon:yes gene_type:complete